MPDSVQSAADSVPTLEDLRAVRELSNELWCLAEASGRILRVGGPVKMILDRAPESLVGASFFDLLHPDDVPVAMAALARLADDGVGATCSRIRAGNGEYVRFAWRMRRAEGDRLYALGTLVGTPDADPGDFEDEEHRRLFARTPLPTWVFDTENLAFLSVNRAATEFYGYTREEFLARRLTDLRRPEDLPQLFQQLEDARVAQAIHPDSPHRRKDGSVVHVMTIGYAVSFGGRPARMVMAIDLTEQTRSREALKLAEQQLDRALAASPAILYTAHTDASATTACWVSANVQRVLGYTVDEALAPGWWLENLHPDDRDRVLAHTMLAERGGFHEYRFRRKDGDYRWIRDEIRPTGIECSGRRELAGIWCDVTSEREAEQELRSIREQRSALLDNLPDIAFLKDRNHRFIAVNTALSRSLGVPAAELLGRTEADFVDAERADRHVRDDDRVLATGKQLVVEELLRAADGRQLWVETIKSPYRDASGEFAGVVGIARDITARRAAEEQLNQARRMEAIGQLAGGVAHDFNNILTVISGACGFLIDDAALPEAARPDLLDIREAAERAAKLTRQLLAYSRRQVLQTEALDVTNVIEGVVPMLRRLITEDIEIVSRLDTGCGQVMADRGQLEQVLLNLALNARDAMPDGGRLSLESRTVHIEHDHAERRPLMAPGRYVVFAVSDTGIGMDESVRARLFEPFFTTKPVGEGTGLGLATAYGIVKQSGGFIWVYSEPGEGSTFKVYLPCVEEAPSEPLSIERPARGVGERILFVEDEEPVRQLGRRILERYGYTVLSARNGEEAMAVLESAESLPDLIVADVVMPRMSGTELHARAVARGHRLPILYVSGYTDDEVFRRGKLAPGSAFLQKPYTAAGLTRAVRRALGEPVPA